MSLPSLNKVIIIIIKWNSHWWCKAACNPVKGLGISNNRWLSCHHCIGDEAFYGTTNPINNTLTMGCGKIVPLDRNYLVQRVQKVSNALVFELRAWPIWKHIDLLDILVRSASSSFLICSSWEVPSRTVFHSFSSSNRRLVSVKSCVWWTQGALSPTGAWRGRVSGENPYTGNCTLFPAFIEA